MKKSRLLIVLALVIILAISLVACGPNGLFDKDKVESIVVDSGLMNDYTKLFAFAKDNIISKKNFTVYQSDNSSPENASETRFTKDASANFSNGIRIVTERRDNGYRYYMSVDNGIFTYEDNTTSFDEMIAHYIDNVAAVFDVSNCKNVVYDKANSSFTANITIREDEYSAKYYLSDKGAKINVDLSQTSAPSFVMKLVFTAFGTTKVDIPKNAVPEGIEKPEVKPDEKPEEKPMDEIHKYVLGDKNEVNLATALSDYTGFTLNAPSGIDVPVIGNPSEVTLDNDVIKVVKMAGPFYLFASSKADGNYHVFFVNVQNASNLCDANTAENDLRNTVANPNGSVVLHTDIVTKNKRNGFTVADGNTVYGNDHEIHADSFAARNGNNGWGAHVFQMQENSGLQDLHIFVNTVREGYDFFLEDFEYSGNGIDITSKKTSGEYGQITLKNCIVENGQKLLHVAGGNVLVDGCMFRNAADACIAAGTYGDRMGNNITIRNSVAANSKVAGFLFYGNDRENGVAKGDTAHQQTLNIEGFFDIYNWVDASQYCPVPSTEGYIAPLVNNNLPNELKKPMFDEYLVKGEDGKNYIHAGIIRLSTDKVREQNPTITYNGIGGKRGELDKALAPIQLTEKSFPLPAWALKLGIIESVDVINFDTNATPYIAPCDKLEGYRLEKLLHEMKYGRPSMPAYVA